VVAAGPSATDYEWAIITGGPPTQQGANGKCTLPMGSINGNGEGFWLFFRNPTPSQAEIDAVRAVASTKGLDLSVLIGVPQAGCQYATFPNSTRGSFLNRLIRG
jgi:hypothetical protein